MTLRSLGPVRHSHPIGAAVHHLRAHSRGYADAAVIMGTVAFLALGALIAITMVPNFW